MRNESRESRSATDNYLGDKLFTVNVYDSFSLIHTLFLSLLRGGT